MEEDRSSDSGVSTLRSDGARSSGDERSGSRSSAVSDERSAASAEPDIKIVGTVPGVPGLSSQFYSRQPQSQPQPHHLPTMSDRHNVALPPNSLSGKTILRLSSLHLKDQLLHSDLPDASSLIP